MSTLVIVLALVLLTLLVWTLWKPMLTPPKRPVESGHAKLYFFYTNWCGFSQKAMPQWEALEAAVKETPYFGSTLVATERVDAEKDVKTAMLYEVNAYPTIKLETAQGIRDYTGARTKEALLGFLRSSLGKERESL